MVKIGTPCSPGATKLMLLGSGELGREVAIEAIRLGVEVIAVDRYPNAPAMQAAQKSHVLSMLDDNALRKIIEQEKPDFIVPEIEAIATQTLLALENDGYKVVPAARAVSLTMNREGIRKLAAEELGLPTSPYVFAGTLQECGEALNKVGLPCIMKPVMSSSGKGQSMIKTVADLPAAWEYAQSGARGGQGRVILEGVIDFDYEITQLTVRHKDGITFCEPIGHIQEDGDYRQSWQPQPMSPTALQTSRRIAEKVVNSLGGWGIFGVELFIKGDQVWFSEVSPRPHDTGLVTCISQSLSEFALHVRAILGLPIPQIRQNGPAASAALLVHGESTQPVFHNLDQALAAKDTALMLFGKPEVKGKRRMGVALALGTNLEEARAKAQQAVEMVRVSL